MYKEQFEKKNNTTKCSKCVNNSNYYHIFQNYFLCDNHYSYLQQYKFSKNDYELNREVEIDESSIDKCMLCNSTEEGLWNKYDGEKVCNECIIKNNFSRETDKSIKNRKIAIGEIKIYGRTLIISGDY